MIPIDNDKIIRALSPEQEKRKQEIQDFIAAGCEWAELWRDDRTSISNNIDRYKLMARKMKVSRKITFHSRGGKVLVRCVARMDEECAS